MPEKVDNLRRVHESAISPDPLYTKLPLDWFVGRHIKMAFRGATRRVEHMWVEIVGIDGFQLVGTVANEPVVATEFQYGQQITLSATQVEAVLYCFDEWMAEAAQLAAEADYFNRHLGSPTKAGSGLEALYSSGLTPRQALRWWASWSPLDGDGV